MIEELSGLVASELKCCMSDIFGDYGVWKSLGGKARELKNDRIKVTQYENNSLILKGYIGQRINQLVIQAKTKERNTHINLNSEPQK